MHFAYAYGIGKKQAEPAVTKGRKPMQEYILEMRNITKEFPGVKALDQVSFQVKKGEIKALVGENGAGKSTLMKCILGYYRFSGSITLDGAAISPRRYGFKPWPRCL